MVKTESYYALLCIAVIDYNIYILYYYTYMCIQNLRARPYNNYTNENIHLLIFEIQIKSNQRRVAHIIRYKIVNIMIVFHNNLDVHII